jgi:hypothetical protein
MVVNRIQNGLINSSIQGLTAKKKIFSNGTTFFFFSNSDRDFYSENNNVSQVYT